MPDEPMDKDVSPEALEAAGAELRMAFAQFGPQHPAVLGHLERYAALQRQAGNIPEAEKFEQAAAGLKAALLALSDKDASPAPAEAAAKAAPAPVEASEEPRPRPADRPLPLSPEKDLFNSSGQHVATAFRGHIYSPEGRHLGRWDGDLGVFLDRHGWYLGEIFDGIRLLRNTFWEFRHLNFGDTGNEGDRPGTGRRPDVGPSAMPDDCEDAMIP